MKLFLNELITPDSIDKFENAVRSNDMVGVLLVLITILITLIIFLYRKNETISQYYQNEMKVININLTKKEDERIKKAQESEKELIEVLNSVSTIIRMSEQADKFQNDKILSEIKNYGERILDKFDTIKK